MGLKLRIKGNLQTGDYLRLIMKPNYLDKLLNLKTLNPIFFPNP